MLMKELENIFGFRGLQEFCTILGELKTRNLSIEDLEVYVDKKIKFISAQTKGIKALSTKLCPECGSILTLNAVNTGPRDQTGDDSKSVWSCPRCYREEFSELSVHQQVQEAIKLLRMSEEKKLNEEGGAICP